jgi:hypothetical protein
VQNKTYRFDLSHESNSGHPISFYYDEDKSTNEFQYLDGSKPTINGIPGEQNCYLDLVIRQDIDKQIYYQCQNHDYMGNSINIFKVYEKPIELNTETKPKKYKICCIYR